MRISLKGWEPTMVEAWLPGEKNASDSSKNRSGWRI